MAGVSRQRQARYGKHRAERSRRTAARVSSAGDRGDQHENAAQNGLAARRAVVRGRRNVNSSEVSEFAESVILRFPPVTSSIAPTPPSMTRDSDQAIGFCRPSCLHCLSVKSARVFAGRRNPEAGLSPGDRRELSQGFRLAGGGTMCRRPCDKELPAIAQLGRNPSSRLRPSSNWRRWATRVSPPQRTSWTKNYSRPRRRFVRPRNRRNSTHSIEKLRKTLADLRHDPDLSKDQLHDVGLPALEELNLVYQQRAKAMAAQAAKSAHAVESLRQTIVVLQLLQEAMGPRCAAAGQ